MMRLIFLHLSGDILMPYVSLFDRSQIITTRDMCELLNLDINRPHLNFSAAEIRKAYQKRVLRFHPDRQPHLSPRSQPRFVIS